MSTMLKTAAMSILSKTLQTFLYKYLLDVDVEGVAMPSLMDVDGQSGWGVRLCNVRLREGVELMNLPGKRKIRVKKKKPEECEVNTEDTDVRVNETEAVAPRLEDNESTLEEENDENLRLALLERDVPYSDGNNEVESVASSRPPTPDYSSGNRSVLGCFTRAPKTPQRTDLDNEDDDELETPQTPSRGLSLEEREELHRSIAASKKQEEVTVSAAETKEEQKEEEEEEFEMVDQDLILRLGQGGRIGTLDVRLVGKELHVSVEDAFLVAEACPKPEVQEEEENESLPGEDAESSTAKASPEKAKKSTKKKAAPQTVGERILEKSGIARALSAMPQLLLRDVRVQLIVREDAPQSDGEADAEISEKDCVLEAGVELLSVTSGEDILHNIRLEEETEHEMNGGAPRSSSSTPPTPYFDESSDDNEYLVKRIRTGRGPEGGIWVNVYPPGTRNKPLPVVDTKDKLDPWASRLWLSTTRYCFFRCSGLDVRARMYLGKREDVSKNEWAFYDEFSIDTMLYSVDYIAPGPNNPLPPLERGLSTMTEYGSKKSLAMTYTTDRNGVQSSQIGSAFHRVARGMIPSVCKGDHLPCENCSRCWEVERRSQANAAVANSMDSLTPMPGLVFNLSLKDPLEINVDRAALDVLGRIVNLFTGEKKSDKVPENVEEPASATDGNSSQKPKSGTLSSLRDRFTRSRPSRPKQEESLKDAFPSYMQPENIEIRGLHLSKVFVRIHVMRKADADNGFSFCYWDTVTRCITLDSQSLSAEGKGFSDIRFDIGEFSMLEYKGIECKRLVSLGLPQPDIDDNDAGSMSSHSIKNTSRPAWPSTASALLNLQPPLETAHYESRERHGLQVRYMALSPQTSQNNEQTRSQMNVRLGVVDVDMPYQVKSDISTIMSETKASLFGPPKESLGGSETSSHGNKKLDSDPLKSSSLMKYKFQVDGGGINLYPVVNLKLPLTRFEGGRSSETGLFLETLFSHLTMAYGAKASPKVAGPPELSLSQMAKLPEKVRMRVLLFLKDLGPLERALDIKRESNSFLRFSAVNKGIVKQAKKSAKAVVKRKKGKTPAATDTRISRRQMMLSNLMKLDDSSLEDLWNTHQKSLRRHRKKLTAEKIEINGST